MYVQQTFQETFELLRKNPKNIFVYLAPQIALGFVGLLAYALFMGIARMAGFLTAGQSSAPAWLGILFLALVAVFVIVLIPVGIALLIFYNRVAYLTSKGMEIPLSSSAAHELMRYVKMNFISFLKLLLLMLLAMVAVYVSAILVFIALFMALPLGLGAGGGAGGIIALALMAAIGAIFVAVYALVYAAMNTSFSLFFMGGEQAGTLEVAKRAFSLVRGNLIEYVLLCLGYFAASLAFFVLYILMAMTCILQPVAYALMIAFQFGIYVSMFVFVGHLVAKK